MPLLRVNATASGVALHACMRPLGATIARAARQARGPGIVMVHGYKYMPGHATHCPHRRIFARGVPQGWPDVLVPQGGDGFGVAFGWNARGSLGTVYGAAQAQGHALAALVRILRRARPDEPVQIIAHSLGATLAMAALPHLQRGDIGRILLLAGAVPQDAARGALRTEAGRGAELVNLVSRENDVFDFAFEQFLRCGPALGQGLAVRNALTVQIDCPATLAVLARLGHPIGPPSGLVCHRSVYARDGIMAFNRALLMGADDPGLGRLARLLPDTPAPRWSRLRPDFSPLSTLAAQAKSRIMPRYRSKGSEHEHAY